MRTRIVAVAALGFALFMANQVTQTIPSYVAIALWSVTVLYLVGCWKMTSVMRPAEAPPALTGPVLAKGRWLMASIGTTRNVSPLWVTAYADRLVIGTPLTGSRTLMADELGPISTHGTRRLAIQIEHRTPGLVSPVTLGLRASHPLRRALMELVSR